MAKETRPEETTVANSHDNQRRKGMDRFNEFLSSGMCLCICQFTLIPFSFIQAWLMPQVVMIPYKDEIENSKSRQETENLNPWIWLGVGKLRPSRVEYEDL
ncbi:hypothetical protein VNO77_16461 [Canavalia gladiata]|uniref:Uncharacterized protein n=1 Tax=Canavalia gladiata TaxID=3824 RepID=A0AAN9M453_CANGL